jgi:hypothetical protein
MEWVKRGMGVISFVPIYRRTLCGLLPIIAQVAR